MEKMIVVSGGTKGIGRAIINRFAEAGFSVVTCARNENDLEILKQQITTKYDVSFYYQVVDVSKQDEVKKFISFILSLKTKIEVLVNNAGVFIPGQIQEEKDGVLESMMNTNLFSAYYLTKGILPHMQKNKSGHIFSICSTASITPYINGGSYCISKYALLGFTKVLREELKTENIKVTAVLPGATYTSSWEGVTIPEERFMPAEDIAESVFAAFSLSGRTVVEEVLLRPQLGDV